MKISKALPVILLLFFTFNYTQAQFTKAKPVTDSVSKQMCQCITVYKDSITSREQLFKVLQSCLQKYSVPVIDRLLAEDGFVQADDRTTRAAAIRTVGRKLGTKVTTECPLVKQIIAKFNTE